MTTITTWPSVLANPERRVYLAALRAQDLRALPDDHPDRAVWREVVEWAESRGIEPMVQYLGSLRTKSIGELLDEANKETT